MAIELLETFANQILVGVPLKFSVLDEAGNLLLAAGKTVSNDSQCEMLQRRGMFAEFEEPEEDEEVLDRPLTVFDRWERTTRQLDRLLGSLGKAGFPGRCVAFAEELMALVERDPDIAIYTAVRQDPAKRMRWGLNHVLHCALLGQLAATRVGWPREKVTRLVCAALTMNLAIIAVQGRFALVGRITEGQRERIQAHPQMAFDRLREAGVEDGEWLRAVLEHHERVGGGGYPEGIAQPSELAQALRLLDTFMSKISARAGRPAMAVQEAARQLFAEARDNPLAAGVIKEFGIVPPGHNVKLASGELGVVIRRGATAHAPLVAAVTDVRGKPVITTHKRDTAQPAYAIRALDPDPRHLQRIPAERLYGLIE